MDWSRRRYLLATLGVAGVSGCSESLDELPEFGGRNETQVREDAEQIPYDDLYRNVEEYEGQPVEFPDVSVGVLETDTESVQEFYGILPSGGIGDKDRLFCVWAGSPRIKRGDDVSIWGVVDGLHTNEFGGMEESHVRIEVVDLHLS